MTMTKRGLIETGLQEQWYLWQASAFSLNRHVFIIDDQKEPMVTVSCGFDPYHGAWEDMIVLRGALLPVETKFNTLPISAETLSLGSVLTLYCGCVVQHCKGPTPYPSWRLNPPCSEDHQHVWEDGAINKIRWQFAWPAGSIILAGEPPQYDPAFWMHFYRENET